MSWDNSEHPTDETRAMFHVQEIIARLENELATARQELREAVEALRPFADGAAELPKSDKDFYEVWHTITAGNFRAAAKIVKAFDTKEGK